tara:strand:- start:113711 stop:113887 length:177 start_codon:yes stop_codon:yes gene_type:complete
MNSLGLEIALGIVFALLGFGLLIRYKRLSTHKYYRIIILITGFLFVGFGVYLALRNFL